MTPVGIIANPTDGKDIRRVIAHASVFDNNEKVNILRRILVELDAAGVRDILIMPDAFGVGTRALARLELESRAMLIEMPITSTARNSTRAAELLRAAGAGCIITLGGDGTNRAVALACGEVPLLPISTGTNNVYPQMISGHQDHPA